MVLFSAAWTWGMATPARADAAANLPVLLINSRREVRESWFGFIGSIFLTLPDGWQIKKWWPQGVVGFRREQDSEPRFGPLAVNRIHTVLCGARHDPRG